MKLVLSIICFFSLMACVQQGNVIKTTAEPELVLKKVYYDGVEDDLLTAGLGLSGLRGAAPELANQPTSAALRQASYYHQFKALNDLTEAGGFGRLYGFTAKQAAIKGHEYWSQRQLATNAFHTAVLQIPDEFDVTKACLVVAPSSGSRNVLGAVSTSGAWALTHGCAVVYSDKGTGTQVALDAAQNYQVDGLLTESNASEDMQEATILKRSSASHVVQKHPYSQAHPEQYWGDFVLDAAEYALAILKQEKQLNRPQVKVIAASISNGGGAVLRAAEVDKKGLLDAVVAAEPQVNLSHEYTLLQGQSISSIKTKPLLELSMHLSLFEPCAALAPDLNNSPFKMNTMLLQPAMKNRCQALKDANLLSGSDWREQAVQALAEIRQLNITEAALQLSQLNTLANIWGSINHTYSNSYLKKTANDNLCQSAMSAFTASGEPRSLSGKETAHMFALSNGIAPSNGIELAYTNQQNQVQSRMLSTADIGFRSQLCFYQLLDTAALNEAISSIEAEPVKNSVPTIILHGQADGTVAINHASRAYFHQNQSSQSPNEQLRYYEIEHAQHFDAFLAYPGFNQRFVPMHPYFEQALELMYMHLFKNQPLPVSQVIKTQARGMSDGQVQALRLHHIPAITYQPKHRIKLNQQQLEIQ